MLRLEQLNPYPYKFLCYQFLRKDKKVYGKAHIYSFRSEKTN